MMMSRPLATAALAASIAAGCSSDPRQEALNDSRAIWRALAAGNAETYSYEVGTSSWTGFASRTVLQFESGVATYRRFEVLTPQQDGGTGVLTLQWEERGTEVGAHPVAAPPATVDALYDQCAREVLPQDPDRNDVVLYFDDAGILLACFYIPRNCADDCGIGVGIGNLQIGKTY
jgi:hypothetical protein